MLLRGMNVRSRGGSWGPVSISWSRKDQSSGRGDEEKQVVESELAGLGVESASKRRI